MHQVDFSDYKHFVYSENIEDYKNYLEIAGSVYPDEEKTVKLYYDKGGKLTVIDDAGYFYIDFEELADKVSHELSCCYVEIITGVGYDFGNRVNIVYTDSMDNLPKTLPDIYNYAELVFDWNGDKSYLHDGFILGTSEFLNDGIPFLSEEADKCRSDREIYNGYANELYKFAEEYFGAEDESFLNQGRGIEGCSSIEAYNTPEAPFYITVEKSIGQSWRVLECVTENSRNENFHTFAEDISDPNGKFVAMLNEKLGTAENVRAKILGNANDSATFIFYKDEASGYELRAGVSSPFIFGVCVVAADSGISLNEYGLPTSTDYLHGYFTQWNGQFSDMPCIKGLCYPDKNTVASFGSYCTSTGMPLDGYKGSLQILYEQTIMYDD